MYGAGGYRPKRSRIHLNRHSDFARCIISDSTLIIDGFEVRRKYAAAQRARNIISPGDREWRPGCDLVPGRFQEASKTPPF